jgi:hypothetical protein
MNINSTLTREDGKLFTVVDLAHWSQIESADGEKDLVKMYGADNRGELYVSASKGFGYITEVVA